MEDSREGGTEEGDKVRVRARVRVRVRKEALRRETHLRALRLLAEEGC